LPAAMGRRKWSYKINVKLVKMGVWFRKSSEGCRNVAIKFGALALCTRTD